VTLFVFTILFSLDRFGGGSATVVAPNPVAALAAAVTASDEGWMLEDAHVNVYSITRGFLAHCEHWNGTGVDDVTMECDDCGVRYRSVWGEGNDTPAPSATTHGFRAYCESLTRH
jgi:hypothetical protein